MNKLFEFLQMQILPQSAVLVTDAVIDPIDDITAIGQLLIQAVIAIFGIIAAMRKSRKSS